MPKWNKFTFLRVSWRQLCWLLTSSRHTGVTDRSLLISYGDSNVWPGALLQATRSRTRQNFELVHIFGPVQNFGPPAQNFGPLRAEFAWREWRKTLGGHVGNWAGLSGFSPRENNIFHTFFIDCINKYSKVSNAHNSDDCHGVFNGGMLNKGFKLFTIALRLLGFDAFFPWVILICAKSLGCQTKENIIKKQLTKFGKVWKQRNLSRPRKP